MATNPQTQVSRVAVPTGSAAGTYALGAAPLMALTQDQKFLATLKKVSEPAHPVRVCGSEIDFSAALMAQHAGVAVLDSAAVATPIEKLTTRLHSQFPDLVLVVAGTADEQGTLAAQITDGTVHRFLHKPVSEQRVRLFAEAAWRRHEEGLKDASATAPRVPRRRGPQWLLILAVVLAVAAPLGWLALRDAPSDSAAAPGGTRAAAAVDDAALEQLLARADQALAADALVSPPDANAADLYRAALRRNARDPRAVAGLEQVIDRLVTDAEAQLAEHRLDAAQQLADAARAINPNHPRVAFLTAQIGAQRERAVLGKAQRAAAGGDVGAALAVLDDASRGGHNSTLVDEARQQLAQKQVSERVADFVARGRAALGSGALIEPPEQNAHFFIESAHALAPSDAAVQQARTDLVARLQTEARQAITAGNPDQADTFSNAAAESGADFGEVEALRSAAQQLRGVAKADALAHVESLFNQRLAQGRLVEPGSDSAKYYLEQLAQAEPASAATLAARTSFETRLLDEAHAAAQAQNLPAARRWLTEAQNAGASPAGVSAVEAEINAASGAAPRAAADAAAVTGAAPAAAPSAAAAAAAAATAPETGYVSASTLKRTRYIAPEYPQTAREHGVAGWVDLQFTVNTDGTLSEVSIVGAQPVGVFEPNALDAVRHWRYEPVVREGAPVAQRARVRVRFAVQP